ncbi:MAG TPA: amino acid adenylation domain-containing protein, partial [Thermoanaerobaculia bacterium]|nr:amino acid adenylation domain-containing protein [Thermoanaerobaculia bacterium]
MATRNLEDVYPLSPLQEGILFHSLYASESGVYVEQLSCALAGPLDAAAFARAWERVIERHAVLRTAFVWKSQKRPLQAVQRAVALPLRSEDWSHLAAGEREARFAGFLAEDRQRGFEAARAPLLRIALLRFGAGEHRLVWTFHHLLLDGWSLPLVLSEVLRFYAAFAAGRDLTLPAPRPYRDYITWVERQDLAAAEAFFRRALEGFTEPTEVDLPRPVAAPEERQRRDPDDCKLTLGSERHARLSELARRHRLTLNTLLQGAWAALLGRYLGRYLGHYAGERRSADDVVFGTTVSGRGIPLAGIESMIGLFINTLPVRARLDPRAEVGAWLAGLQESQLARQAFETTPLPRIQGWSELPPGTPLAASLFVFENYPQPILPKDGSLALGEVRFRERTSYPLTAIAAPAGEDLELRLAWDPEHHDAATAARLLAHWARLVAALGEALGAAPGSAGPRLGDLPMLSEAERQQMVAEWNPRPPAEPAELAGFLLHERFAAQAARTPDAVALTAPPGAPGAPGEREGGGELTYGELAGRAGRLAAVLRRRGVGAESLVAICLERSLDLVVALLAVLEAGGAYLPLDPAYPPEQLGFMVDDSGARVLVSRPELAARLPPHGAQLVTADDGEGGAEDATEAAAPLDSGGDLLAYVIYTSGSTGRPKGVAVTHGDVSRLLAATHPFFGFGPDDVWTLLHSYAFDFSVWEIWGALAHGGRLVVVPYAVSRAPEELLRLLAAERVTVLNQTPGAFAQLAPAALAGSAGGAGGVGGAGGEGLPDLRLVIFGGEALDPAVLAGWLGRFGETRPRLVNMYGITETTVHATWRPLGSADLAMPASPASPIGRPLAHLQVHLLDRHGRLVPLGVAGEMHVGGTALARGYLGRPELTAERFLPDGFGGGGRGARLYKTGDLARWRPDGELEFLGRADRQVKIRGHRVELGEVEAALAACPGVRAAAVVARERDGVRRLVAYVAYTADAADLAEQTAADLRTRLSRTLPEPMLPAAIVRLAALPLTPNGKVDLRALAALPALEDAEDAAAARAGAAERIAPRGPVEELLAGLWAEVLRLPEVGVHDNFFALGGDSILSLQVVARASQAGCRITPRQLFEHPTIAGLAAAIENTEQNARQIAEPSGAREEDEAAGEVPLTPIQRWFLDREPADPHHFNQALLLAVRRPPPAPPAALARAIAALVAHHDALRLRFRRDEGRWRQRRLAPASTGRQEMVRIDLSGLAEERVRTAVTAAAAAAQQSLDLAAGPLLRALWLDLPAGEARLFLAVHHLAVDGVSWRILLDDLATAWRQIGRGEPARLPPRTASFRRWAERLAEQARTMAAEPEIAFWLAQTAAPAPPAADALDTVATAASVAVELGEADTADLLRALPAAYGASIADALVAALAATLAASPAATLAGPGGAVCIDLEGHGREEVSGDRGGDLDLSRSVGWFTSLYPVRLVPGDDPRPEAALAAVRRQLAAVPGRGLGYGLLRYLSEHPAAAALRDRPPSPVSFNYLGQLDAALPADSPFAAAGEPVGPSQSPRAGRSHALAVVAFVAAGRLEVTWTYGAHRLAEEVVRGLAERLLARLRELAAGARSRVLTLAPLAPIPAPIPEENLARLPADVEDAYPLSPLQEGLLFHSLYAPGSGAYVEQLHATFEGDLDLAAFREAWRRIVAGMPVLRTSFHGDDLPRPLQAVHRQAAVEIVEEDWRPLAEPERERRFAALVRADRLRGFDLARPPLLRWTLVRTGERAWRFLWSHHHALLDGWSYAALIGDFAACYEALAAGREPALRARPPYRDFIAWLSRRDPASDDDFFGAYLAGFGAGSTAPTPLAADRPAPALDTAPDPAVAELRLSTVETAALQAAVRARGLTLNTLAQGAWALLLGRASGERDVVFGATVSGRPPELPGVEAMLGLFINTLPARVRLPDEASVSSWLAGLQAAQAELRQHEAAPLVRIQEVSPVARGTALFDSVLVFENYPQAAIRASALGRRITDVFVIEQTHYPLTLNVVPGDDRLLLSLGYDRARFDATTVERRLGHLKGLFATLAASLRSGLAGDGEDEGEESLAAIGLPLSAAERQQLLREWSDAAPVGGAAGGAAPVHELFAAQAARRPDAVALVSALVSGNQVLTYGELARRSSRMARRLAELGVGPGMLVGLCAERSPELILGVLAILAAGGAYLPLDPAHPTERLAYTLADAGAPVLLAEEHLRERLPAGAARVVGLNALVGGQEAAGAQRSPCHPGDLAYVIYTSGSTGRPKGVEVSHANAARLFAVLRQEFAFGPDDVWTLFHSIAFDFSVWELWGALAFGGRLVVVPSETARSTEAFYELLRRERVTVLSQTPSAFRQLLWAEESAVARGEAMVADLRLVVFGGEALDPPSLTPWLERHGEERPLLVNMYGITETTVHTTWRRLRQSDLARPGSAVGRPLSDLVLHLLDGGGRPVPIGVPGEIHVGGAGVARGYLARPALTAERFVPDPFAGGNIGGGGLRLYRSGDLARWRADGDLEYLGRIDRQVKVRGYRIELGEIEAALAEHPGVREAAVVAVVAREDRPGDVRLVGYVSSVAATAAAAQPDPSPQALAAFLAERLPGYMVPAAWVLLDRLPLTPNGKVDRAALPAPEERGSGGAYLAPRSPVEQVLAGIWEEVLERQRVGAEDDFFALGGHSLVAAQVTSRVLKAFSVDLPLRALFERPTVAALAVEVERLRGSGATAGAPPLVRAPRGTEAPLSFTQERLWFYDQLSPGTAVYNVPLALALRGALSVPALAAALAAEVDRHEALRTRFVAVGGRPLQRVDPPWRPPLPLVDLCGLPPAVVGREMEHLAAVERTLPFDLARGRLLRAVLLRREEAFVLLLTFHHIMSDGWSMGVLARELTALYGAALAGLPSPLPELPLQFRDFAIWQRAWLQGEALERLLGAAITRLAGVPRLDLPLDRPPEAERYFRPDNLLLELDVRSGNLPLELDVALTASLSALSRRQGASLFMTLLAAFTGLLRRHTGRGDFAVLAVTAGRTRADLEPLFGYFTNTLVIRAAAAGDPDFGELLRRTRMATLAAYDHQDLPFSYLAEALRAERPGEPPLFDVFFLSQPPMPEIAVPGAEAAPFPLAVTEGETAFTLALELAEVGGRLMGSFSYNLELFDLTTALRWRGHLEALLASAVADPARPLTELPLLSAGERHQVTVEWGEAVRLDGGPAPIGIWGKPAGTASVAGAPAAPAGRRARFLADGTLEASAPALAGPAETKAAPAPAPAAAAAGELGEPARSLESLSPVKRKLLAKRIRGE